MPAPSITLLDAAYAVHLSETEWIEHVLVAAIPSLDHGRGVYAFSYDASDPSQLRLGAIHERNVERPISDTDEARAMLGGVDPNFVQETYLVKTCALASDRSEFAGTSYAPLQYLRSHRIEDVLIVNARDPSGIGWVVGGYLPERRTVRPRERAVWSRMAAHIAAAYRLRRRARETADARLSVEGNLEDGGRAAESARDALKAAVIAFERAHALAPREVDEALRAWRVLVDARWSLIADFESDGGRYIVARRNDSDARGSVALTKRERQVLSLAALGQSNKLIAYELGISHATVRVLVSRAAAKLGVASRAALLAVYAKQRPEE